MRCLTGFGLSALALGAAVAYQQPPPKPDVSAQLRYDAGDGRKIEAIGVCNVTPDSVSCWNTDGKDDPALTERTQAYFLNTTNDVAFRFRRKNRFVVMRRLGLNYAQYQTDTGGYLNSFQSNYASGEPVTEWVRMSTDPALTETALIAVVEREAPVMADLALREGASMKYQGATIGYGASRVSKTPLTMSWNGMATPDPKAKSWELILSYEPGDNPTGFGYTPLDGKGAPIRYVDRDGKPVSSVEYLKSAPNEARNPGYGMPPSNSKYRQAILMQDVNVGPGALVLQTNIDPSAIKSLRLSSSRQTRVLITGIPLDPK